MEESIHYLLKRIYDSLENRNCSNCKHYSTGKQPDGFKWHKCDYAFECKTCFNDYFEGAEQ